MAQQKKGFFTRMLEGKERSEEYARSTLPTNRWQLFWDIFKGNFGKIFKINLLVLLFFIPTIVWIVVCGVLDQSNGVIYPFGSNLGVGVGALPEFAGVSEYITLQSNMMRFGGIAISCFVACVGLSGGMYVIRNMVWTEGIFVTNDFWRGVKLNYKNALQAGLFLSVILFICNFFIDTANVTLALEEVTGFRRFWFVFSKILSVSLIVLSTFMTFWMISLGVNYEQKFFALFKNAFFMTVGMIPQTVFFAAMALLPFLLFLLGDFFTIFAIFILLIFGLAWCLLVWISFSQWAFDKFINPKLQGAKVGRGLFNKDGTRAETGDESAAEKEYRRTLLAAGKSNLVARPIKPIDDELEVYELPTSFTREDLKRLRESKTVIKEDSEAYEQEHKNDARYVEYNKQFEERERALQDTDTKKKKRKPPKLLGQ